MAKTAKDETVEEVVEPEGIQLEGPSDEALIQALYQASKRRTEQLEVENARLTLLLQEVGQKLAAALDE